ncbi:MAG: S8 family serine peptidase, partial [bacterium]|nr:S8 family serine peptidase [bacterium]
GTSQASPHAAACAALLQQATPSLTPDDVEAALEASPTLVTDATNGLRGCEFSPFPLAIGFRGVGVPGYELSDFARSISVETS